VQLRVRGHFWYGRKVGGVYLAYILGRGYRCRLRSTLRSIVTHGGHEHHCRAPPVRTKVRVCLTRDMTNGKSRKVNHKIDNQDRRKKFIADQMAALQFANGTLRS
jgi:hypothetical protein